MPAISTGVQGFPFDLCANTMIKTITEWCICCDTGDIEEIRLMNYEKEIHAVFMKTID